EELLNSINNQEKFNLDIEVCISDNASTDGTEEMIDVWRNNYNFPIIYRRNSVNLGPDRNFLASVSLANGDYCWIFGSDDALAKDSLAILQTYLDSQADIYLCDRKETGCDLVEIRNPHRSWLRTDDELYVFNNNLDREIYLSRCLSIGGVFSYLSSLIVKKERWDAIDFDASYIGTSYPHVFIMMSVFNTPGCLLHYISKPLVICRGDNDSFEKKGKARRILIDFIAYLKLANDFYSKNISLKRAFENVLLKERPWLYTTLAMACYGNSDEKRDLSEFYAKLGCNKNMINTVLRFGKLA
ncbi:abequosyltransferase RfbV, partial [Salmonella enterica]|nr:abequosyltransferase RfbV [Salmonella enterica]